MSLLVLPLLLLAPGYVTLAAWRGARGLDFWERLFLVPFVSILLTSWVGMLLAETGTFSLTLLSLIVGVYCVLVAFLARQQIRPGWLGRPDIGWTSILLVAILALAGWAFSRPAEVVGGTFDPGIYLSTGATIARTGSIAFTDPFVSQLDSSLRPFLLEQRQEIGVGAVRLPAFWMPVADENTVIPAFFHLYPVWLAILHSLGGLQAALFVSPFFGLMGVWALFLIGRRLGGPGVGLLAAALLAANPAQVWFARYPISEATVQMLLLGGLAAWVLMEEHRSRLLAVVAGAGLGLAHLAKIDQMFVPVAIGVSIFLVWVFNARKQDASDRRPYAFVLAPYVLLAIHAAIHAYLFSFAYAWINLGPFLPGLFSAPVLRATAVICLVALGAAVFREKVGQACTWLLDRRGALTAGLAGLVGVTAAYGYFLWPLSPDPGSSVFLSSDGVTPVYLQLFKEEGLVRLGWYLSPLGLLLGLAGFVYFVGSRSDRRALPLLVLFVAHTALYILTAGLAYPVHFWASRRYVPLVIPVFLLLMAILLERLSRGRRRGAEAQAGPRFAMLVPYILPAALASLLMVSFIQNTARFFWQTEYRGALQGIERWARQMEDPAIVLFKPRMEGNIFSSPLQNFFGKTSFVLQREMEEPFFTQGIQRWLSAGDSVYLVLSDRYPTYLSGDVRLRLIDDQGLGFQSMEQTNNRLPEAAGPVVFPLRLYRLEPAKGYPYRLPNGPMRMDQVLQLQLARPSTPSLRLTFRAWTSGQAPLPVSVLINDGVQQEVSVTPQAAVFDLQIAVPDARTSDDVEMALRVGDVSISGMETIVLEWLEVAEAAGY